MRKVKWAKLPDALKPNIAASSKIFDNPEQELLFQIQAAGLPEPRRNYQFFHDRKWKADFAWIDQNILVEIEGGIWTRGRHVRGVGYTNDCEKYNMAQSMGWKVYRFTPEHVRKGAALLFLERELIVEGNRVNVTKKDSLI